MKFFRFAFCTAALIANLAHAVAQDGVSDDSIKIGTSVVISGPLAPLGIGIRDGIEAYFATVNSQGGVGGRKLKLIALDDAYSAEKTAANINKLIQEERVFSLIGVTGTPGTTVAIPLASKAGVPFFGPFTGADEVRVPHNRYFFTATASYGEEMEKIVEHITTFGIKRIAVVYLNNNFGKSGLSGVERAMTRRKLDIIGSAPLEPNSANLKTAVEQIAKLQPQVVIMATAGKATADFVADYKQSVKDNTSFYCLSVTSAAQMNAALGSGIRGVAVSQTMPSPWNGSPRVVREYQKAMAAAKLGDYSYASLQGFITAKIMVEGLKRAGKNLSREKFIDALESMDKVDVGDYMVSFSPTKHNGSNWVDITVFGKQGKFLR